MWLAILDQELSSDDLQATLPRLSEPVLPIWGGTDPIMLPENRQTLRNALPKAQVKILPDYGHNPFWKDPTAAAKVINASLAS